MIVRDNMTPDPVSVSPDASARTALVLMDDCDIRHLPVVHVGRLVGVVSDRDLMGACSWRVVGSTTERVKSVRELMQREIVTVTPDDQIVSALVEVVVGGVGCLPVMEDGQLTGIVTEMDLMDLYARLCRRGPGGPEDPPVAQAMRSAAVTVAPSATAAEADELCHHKGFRHLPVVEGGQLVGLLSDRDLRRRAGAGIDPDTPVAELMSRTVHTAEPAEPLSAAARRMVEHKISALPVEGDSIGIVTSLDVLDHALGAIREGATPA